MMHHRLTRIIVAATNSPLGRSNSCCSCRYLSTHQHQRQEQKHTKGYQAMGSFHSENVDELMNQDESVYKPPDLPFEQQPTTSIFSYHPPGEEPSSSESSNFDYYHRDFMIDRQSWTFLNHGAFGGSLRVAYERAEQWRYHLERNPLQYFDRDLLPHLVYSARRISKFCNAPGQSTTLIPNVTYGLNTILAGYVREYQDQAHIILWETTYGSLKKMAYRYCEKVTEIPISDYFDQWDTEEEDPNSSSGDHDIFQRALIDTIESVDTTTTKHALLVLDHTTSNTALNMPIESLSRLAKEEMEMLVMVDGAHSLLAQEVDITQNYPHVDFYLSNGHKWLSCPRGIGMLFCPTEELRETVLSQPACMSHGIGQGFQSRFLWDGCRDYAAALSVPAALDYWESRGVVETQKELKAKRDVAVKLLGDMWQHTSSSTSKRQSAMTNTTLAPLSIHAPMMALVKLPECHQKLYPAATSDDAKRIQDCLHDCGIEVPIKCINGTLYVRISCHVYNQIHEYERLGKALFTK